MSRRPGYVSAATGSHDGLGPRAGGQAPATKNSVGKAKKAKIQSYVVLLRLRSDIYMKWKETGVWPASGPRGAPPERCY